VSGGTDLDSFAEETLVDLDVQTRHDARVTVAEVAIARGWDQTAEVRRVLDILGLGPEDDDHGS
jgi:uncharacterized tellurite resistance protein B-like protein